MLSHGLVFHRKSKIRVNRTYVALYRPYIYPILSYPILPVSLLLHRTERTPN